MEVNLDLSGVSGPSLTRRLEILLRKHIADGVWKEKECIPTELEISSACGVSRNTVRAAIQRLVSDGLLVRIKGKGTFVSPPKASVSVGVACIRETIHTATPVPVARIVREETSVPSESIARVFGLADGEMLYYIERARYRMVENSAPAMYQYSWVIPEYGEKIDSRELVLGRLTDQLREKCGAEPHLIKESLSAVGANATESRELGIPSGSPLLLLQEERYDVDGRLFTLSKFAIIPSLLQLEFTHTYNPTSLKQD